MLTEFDAPGDATVDLDAIVRYRRDGYLLVPRLIGPDLVSSAMAALADSADGAPGVGISLEPAIDPTAVPPGQRLDHIRKYTNLVQAAPALQGLAMSARLHAVLDRLLGCGRLLVHDMALIKPPRIGSAKPWHQDASYYRVGDPGQLVGVWVALDPATTENGCMEVVPGSHLDGPVPHGPAADIDFCAIRPEFRRAGERVPVPMEPGDVLIFHSLLHHYTAPNRSDRRRRAAQFHYGHAGLEWVSLEAHQRLFHDGRGGYAGCTVQAPSDGRRRPFQYRDHPRRPVEPIPGT